MEYASRYAGPERTKEYGIIDPRIVEDERTGTSRVEENYKAALKKFNKQYLGDSLAQFGTPKAGADGTFEYDGASGEDKGFSPGSKCCKNHR